METAWKRGQVLGEGQNFARELMEPPANVMTPTRFGQVATERLGSLKNVTVTVRLVCYNVTITVRLVCYNVPLQSDWFVTMSPLQSGWCVTMSLLVMLVCYNVTVTVMLVCYNVTVTVRLMCYKAVYVLVISLLNSNLMNISN